MAAGPVHSPDTGTIMVGSAWLQWEPLYDAWISKAYLFQTVEGSQTNEKIELLHSLKLDGKLLFLDKLGRIHEYRAPNRIARTGENILPSPETGFRKAIVENSKYMGDTGLMHIPHFLKSNRHLLLARNQNARVRRAALND